MRSVPPARRKWLVLVVVLAAEIVDLLDATITGVAAPVIRTDLHGSAALVQWLASAYTLPFAALLISAGRLGDLVSQRLLFVVGALGFAVASVGAAAAPSPGALIGARAVQGIFAALLVPQGFGLIRSVFPAHEIRLAYSFFGPVLGIAAVCGPVVGGLLAGTDVLGLGWRVIFLVTVPLGVLAAIGAVVFVPAVRHERVGRRPRIDVAGTALLSAGTVAVIYPLIEGRDLGWPWWGFVLLALGIGLLGVLPARLRRAARAGRPKLVDPTLFANGSYVSGLAVVLGFLGAFAGLLLLVSLYCQTGLGFSAVRTGLTIAPVALGMAIASPFAASQATRHGRRVIRCGLVLALAACGIAALQVSRAGTSTTTWTLAPPLLVAGLGIGCVFAPLFDLILSGVQPTQAGSASGVMNATQQFAAALGVAGLATIYLAASDPSTGFAVAMLGTAGGFGLALVLSRALAPRSIDVDEPVEVTTELLAA